jgi:hypothetical protein
MGAICIFTKDKSEFRENNCDKFLNDKKLEAYETDEIAGTRFYDILIKDGDDFIYI